VVDDLTRLREELADVEAKIARLEGRRSGDERYVDDVARAFHLGRVGGSGKQVRALNRRRSRALDATIDRAVAIVPLYKQRDRLQAAISRIESRPADWEERRHRAHLARVRAFTLIRPGDQVDVGGNDPVTVVRKSRLSVSSACHVRWSIAELTGLPMERCRLLLAEIETEAPQAPEPS
jgi:hypothetical protein